MTVEHRDKRLWTHPEGLALVAIMAVATFSAGALMEDNTSPTGYELLFGDDSVPATVDTPLPELTVSNPVSTTNTLVEDFVIE